MKQDVPILIHYGFAADCVPSQGRDVIRSFPREIRDRLGKALFLVANG